MLSICDNLAKLESFFNQEKLKAKSLIEDKKP